MQFLIPSLEWWSSRLWMRIWLCLYGAAPLATCWLNLCSNWLDGGSKVVGKQNEKQGSSSSAFMVHEIEKKVQHEGQEVMSASGVFSQSCSWIGQHGNSWYFSFRKRWTSTIPNPSLSRQFLLHFGWKWWCFWSWSELRWHDSIFDTATSSISSGWSFFNEGADFFDSYLWWVCFFDLVPWRLQCRQLPRQSLQPRKHPPRRESKQFLGRIVTTSVVKWGPIPAIPEWRELRAWEVINRPPQAGGRWADQNASASWVTCQRCKLRLSYTPTFGAHGMTRSPGPLPPDTSKMVEKLGPEAAYHPEMRDKTIAYTAAEESLVAKLENVRRLKQQAYAEPTAQTTSCGPQDFRHQETQQETPWWQSPDPRSQQGRPTWQRKNSKNRPLGVKCLHQAHLHEGTEVWCSRCLLVWL